MTDQRDPILDELLAEWRAEEDVRPPDDLALRAWTRAVTERHQAEQDDTVLGWVRRALRPRVVRLRLTPAIGLAMASALVAAVWVGRAMVDRPTDTNGATASRIVAAPATAATAPRNATALARSGSAGAEVGSALPREVPVRFVLPATGAHTVAVAGDFNGWQVGENELDDPKGDGVFVGTVWLRPGTYSYMFVVDGKRWVTDPYSSNYRNDGFGQKNAVLRID